VYLKDQKLHQLKIFFEFKNNEYVLKAKCIPLEQESNYELYSFQWNVSCEALLNQLNSGILNKPIKGDPLEWFKEFLLSKYEDHLSGAHYLDQRLVEWSTLFRSKIRYLLSKCS